jgi:hypothetical protein
MKFLAVMSLLPIMVANVAFAGNYSLSERSFEFSAPLVSDKSTLPSDVPFGSIVYDYANSGFYGKDATGTWVSMSTASIRSSVIVNTGNGHGSTNTKIRRFSNTVSNTGSAITYSDSATLGASFTINSPGLYCISYTDTYTAGSAAFGISVNSSQGTTNVQSIADANLVQIANTPGGNFRGNVSACVSLITNDVIRPHTEGLHDASNSANSRFIITKVGN